MSVRSTSSRSGWRSRCSWLWPRSRMRCRRGGRRGWMQWSHSATTEHTSLRSKDVAELHEETIRGSTERYGTELVAADAGAVPYEEHRPGIRLIGEEPVRAQTSAVDRRRAAEPRRGPDQNWIAGARVVAQLVHLQPIVLGDHAHEDRTGHLVFQLQPGDRAQPHQRSVTLAVDALLQIP